MRNEVQDGHPCESCPRWSECNGVDWPTCQEGAKEIATVIDLCDKGFISPNEARHRLGLPLIQED